MIPSVLRRRVSQEAQLIATTLWWKIDGVMRIFCLAKVFDIGIVPATLRHVTYHQSP